METLQYHENRYYGHAMVGLLAPGRDYQLGTNDNFVPPRSTIDYFETVERTMGGRAATQSFFRFLVLPDDAEGTQLLPGRQNESLADLSASARPGRR